MAQQPSPPANQVQARPQEASDWGDGLADFLEPASVPPPATSPTPGIEGDPTQADLAPQVAESGEMERDIGEETARFRDPTRSRWPRLVGYSLLAGVVFGASAWGAVLLVSSALSDEGSAEVEAPSSAAPATGSVAAAGAASEARAEEAEAPGAAPAAETTAGEPAAPAAEPARAAEATAESVPMAEPAAEPAAAEPPSRPAPVARTGSYAERGDAALLRIEPAPPWVGNMSPRRRFERSDAAIAFGNQLERRGDLESAETWFRRAYALRPNPSSAAVRLALFYEARGQYDEAMAWSRHAVDAAPALAAPLYAHGRMLERRGRRAEAIAAYRQALERNPHESRVQRRLEQLGD